MVSIHRHGVGRERVSFYACLTLLLIAAGCATEQSEPPGSREHSMIVTATAYNSVQSQTDSQPSIAAWGDRLEPGMKVVAVSRDLVRMGLTRGTRITIEGLEGEYVVMDKTSRRHRKHIDIYMGTDVGAAKEFGRRQVRIWWVEEPGKKRE